MERSTFMVDRRRPHNWKTEAVEINLGRSRSRRSDGDGFLKQGVRAVFVLIEVRHVARRIAATILRRECGVCRVGPARARLAQVARQEAFFQPAFGSRAPYVGHELGLLR